MISFDLSDEQKELQRLAADFCQKEVMTKATHYDETG